MTKLEDAARVAAVAPDAYAGDEHEPDFPDGLGLVEMALVLIASFVAGGAFGAVLALWRWGV